MMQSLMAVIILGLLHKSGATCPYEHYGAKDSILVAGDYCKNTTVCKVNNGCTPKYYPSTTTTTFNGVSAVGDMSDFTSLEITIKNTPSLVLSDMVLSKSVLAVNFDSIPALDLSNTSATVWPNVQILRIVSCSDIVIVNKINWPPQLQNIALKNTPIYNVPQELPLTVQRIEIQYSQLTDLNHLPENNTFKFLNFHNNRIRAVTNKDWKMMQTLRLSANPLETFAYVQLSTNLQYFNCLGCNLSNITIDADTATALNALRPWDGGQIYVGFAIDKDVATNASECAAIGGVVQPLFQTQSTYSITACVLPNPEVISTTAPTTLPAKNSTIIIGIAAGAFAVIAIAFFCLFKRNKRLKGERLLNSQIGTEGTEETDTSLDLSGLRLHRLELSDLIVLTDKPLASGAYGDVWIGKYGNDQVAIKRLKNRDPRLVQMFINEITLWSQLDSKYIVKFIGASWTRPIEIECVVEFMNLGDLRSYLVRHNPHQFTWEEKYECILSIVSGLIYLHTYDPPIIHRDLKSRNVLLDSVKGTKLTDFGTSRAAEFEDDTMTNGIGTYQWMAPEVIAGTRYSSAADIYSFGIILSEFCTHQVPYSSVRQNGNPLPQLYILNAVCAGSLHPSYEGEFVPSWVKDVAFQCLHLNPSERPTALQLSAILHRL